MSHLNILLLGPPRVALDGVEVEIKRRKAMAILMYLAVTGERQRRDSVTALLWPDSSQSSAHKALRRDLSELNLALNSEWLDTSRDSIALRPGYWLDVAQFRQCLVKNTARSAASLDALATAVDLYRGDFLSGFSLSDSPEFDEWQFWQSENLRQSLASGLERLISTLSDKADYEQAIPYAQRWLALDSLHEPAHRSLIELYAKSGQQAAALRQYDRCRQILADELGAPPSQETTTLYERIRDRMLDQAGLVVPTHLVPPSFLSNAPAQTAPAPSFVARQDELAQLNGFLKEALAGQGRVVFVTGEAGSGKTMLVEEFARQARVTTAGLITVSGNCNAHTGLGDPYLPFREILSQLSGDLEQRWAAGLLSREQVAQLWQCMPITIQALLNEGPNLIDVFVSGSTLTRRVTAAHLENADWLRALQAMLAKHEVTQAPVTIRQHQLFEQYARVLRRVAQQQPLLLVLDDLQWADTGSINLLFHLGRQLAGSQILLLGIYRATDVALVRGGERHPLQPVVNELQRYFGHNQIPLAQAEGRAFVESLLDSERNRLNDSFRAALYQQTHGHALFTVEILRGMQDRGDLVQDQQGYWIEGPNVDWNTLPARVEGAIAERIERLPASLRAALEVASVEGEQFTAEVVAQVQQVEPPAVIRQFSDVLARQHHLVRGHDSQRVGSRRLSRYRFQHILFQQYLYRNLDQTHRSYLHEIVGQTLEQLYGEQVNENAVQLAWHFRVAGVMDKAMGYLLLAGRQAARSSAHEEAITHFHQGLNLLAVLPDSPERAGNELDLQIALGNSLIAIKGQAAAEVDQAFSRARMLCRYVVGGPAQLVPVLSGQSLFCRARAEHQAARELGEQLISLAQNSHDPSLLLVAHKALGAALFNLGEFAQARAHLEQGISLHDPHQHQALAALYAENVGVSCYFEAASTLWFLGYADQGLKLTQESLHLAQSLGHPLTLAGSLFWAGIVHQFRREPLGVQKQLDTLLPLAREHEFSLWLIAGTVLHCWLLIEKGQATEAVTQLKQILAEIRAIGIGIFRPYILGLLAEAHGTAERTGEGLAILTEALEVVDESNERFHEAELHRLRGELLLQEGSDKKAEACFLKAIAIAQRQRARFPELRAVMSLSQCWQQQNRHNEARQMLAGIFDWFTEGFDTPDLQDARTLLRALS